MCFSYHVFNFSLKRDVLVVGALSDRRKKIEVKILRNANVKPQTQWNIIQLYILC